MKHNEGHDLPIHDMMPKAQPTEKETLYKAPPLSATRRKEGNII